MNRKIVYLDTETTGLDYSDEIVQLGVVDDEGKVLIDSLVRPQTVHSWPEAQAIHGISPNDVKVAPPLEQLESQLITAIQDCIVVIYNRDYDLRYLPLSVLDSAHATVCAMHAYAEYRGEWNDYFGNYRWHKLVNAARHVGHKWTGRAHSAVADALACRSVWHFLPGNIKTRYITEALEDKKPPPLSDAESSAEPYDDVPF
ncbi:MAG: 3'-5' exonuclease [Candidatus Thiodiazotropha sp.]